MNLQVKIKNNKGSTMIVVLLVMAVLMILGAVIINTSVAENIFAGKNEDRIKAYYIARAGAQATAEYLVNMGGQELFNKTSAPNSQIGGGTFTVTVEDKLITDNAINVISVGKYNGTSQTAKIKLSSSGVQAGGVFQYAIAAKQAVTVHNNSHSGTIDGNVVSSGGDNTINVGRYTYRNMAAGATPPRYSALSYPQINIPNGCPVLDQSGNLIRVISAKNSPICRKADSLPLHSKTLEVSGGGIVHLYISGPLSITGSGKIDVKAGTELYIYVIGNHRVTFKGSSAAGNVFLYAPDSEVIFDNAGLTYRGSVIGRTVQIFNNMTIIHAPTMFNNVNLDRTYLGITYTGYIWYD